MVGFVYNSISYHIPISVVSKLGNLIGTLGAVGG